MVGRNLTYVHVCNDDAWPVAQELLLDLEDVPGPLALVALLQAYVELNPHAEDYPAATRTQRIAFILQQGTATMSTLLAQAATLTDADLDALARPPA